MLRYGLSTEIFHIHSGPHHNHHNHHESPQPPQSTNTQGRSQRRRERRLRCMLRHERQTVTMALAEQLRHSANRVERDAALRRQTTRAREEEVREDHVLRGQTRRLLGCGRLRFRSCDRRMGSSGTQGSASSWFSTSTSTCRRWRNSWWKSLQPAPAVFQASSPVVEQIAPAPAVFQASSPVVEYIAPAPVVQASSPVPAVIQAPSPVVEKIAPAPVVQAQKRLCGVHCTCASCSSNANACSGVFCTGACSCPSAIASGGVSCTRASFVRIASARWIFVTCANCASCWRSSRLCPRTEFPPLVVDMIFLSLLGGDALRMRLAVCTIGMCTRARRDGRLL